MATNVGVDSSFADQDGLELTSEEAQDVILLDKVDIEHLSRGNYTLKTSLFNNETNLTEENIVSTNFSVNDDDELIQDDNTVDKLTITLPAMNLSPRTTYVIYEAIYQDDELVLAHANPEDKLQTIIVGNSAYDLTLKKLLSGDGVKKGDEFEFNLTFAGLTPDTTYAIEGDDEQTDFTTSDSGTAEVNLKLKGDEQVVIKDLDTLSYYQITEASSAYIASYEQSSELETATFANMTSKNEEAEQELATEEEQILDENGDVAVTYTNHKDKDPEPEVEPILPQENPKTQDKKVSTLLIMLGASLTLCAGMVARRNRIR